MGPIPRLPEHACNMIRELCNASALAIDRIAKENGLDGYQPELAELYSIVFKQVADKASADYRRAMNER